MADEIVRVLRVIEYIGTRKRVEQTVAGSIKGTKRVDDGLTIRAATLGDYPEVLTFAQQASVIVDGESVPFRTEVQHGS